MGKLKEEILKILDDINDNNPKELTCSTLKIVDIENNKYIIELTIKPDKNRKV